jgi:ABC-type amino acid transport substrate-binding protein
VSLAQVPAGGIRDVEDLRQRPVAVDQLAVGEVDAVIYDAPALRYPLRTHPDLPMRAAPGRVPAAAEPLGPDRGDSAVVTGLTTWHHPLGSTLRWDLG